MKNKKKSLKGRVSTAEKLMTNAPYPKKSEYYKTSGAARAYGIKKRKEK